MLWIRLQLERSIVIVQRRLFSVQPRHKVKPSHVFFCETRTFDSFVDASPFQLLHNQTNDLSCCGGLCDEELWLKKKEVERESKVGEILWKFIETQELQTYAPAQAHPIPLTSNHITLTSSIVFMKFLHLPGFIPGRLWCCHNLYRLA